MWIEYETLAQETGLSFSELCKKYKISRTAEWWSVVGKDENERKRHGQKITIMFFVPED